MKWKTRFLVLLFGVIAVLAPFVWSESSISNPASSIALGNAKEMALACKVYAEDHAAKMPGSLHDLVPSYLSQDGYERAKFRDFNERDDGETSWFFGVKVKQAHSHYRTQPAQEWLYFGNRTDNSTSRPILIASPAPSSIRGKMLRVVIYSDFSGAIIPEDEFQGGLKAGKTK